MLHLSNIMGMPDCQNVNDTYFASVNKTTGVISLLLVVAFVHWNRWLLFQIDFNFDICNSFHGNQLPEQYTHLQCGAIVFYNVEEKYGFVLVLKVFKYVTATKL